MLTIAIISFMAAVGFLFYSENRRKQRELTEGNTGGGSDD